ncbi:MAG: hypothetical protein AAGC96_17330 [Pseudomonadota bacterium]
MTSTTLRIIDSFVSRSASLGYRLLARDTLGHSLFSDGAAVRNARLPAYDFCGDEASPQAPRQAKKRNAEKA